MNAMEKTWHAEHFVCAQCGRTFPGGNFLEMDGKAYCEDDYNELFGPKCAFCMKPITDTCINAVGRTYHPDHFYCNSCGIELRGKVSSLPIPSLSIQLCPSPITNFNNFPLFIFLALQRARG